MQHEQFYYDFLTHNIHPRKLISYDSSLTLNMTINLGHRQFINFSSNDYLGLAKHPFLIARSQDYVKRWGVGGTSSRLVTGNLSLYNALEEQLAVALKKPAALIFGSGYQTNISVLEALLDTSVLGDKPIVFCDRYCHASMFASTKHLSRLHRFHHNNYQHLEHLLEKYVTRQTPKFILAESIYSMDGDQANLSQLIALAKKYTAFLYIDDAHAVGVYGDSGWGQAPTHAENIDIIMGTFSKALGSYGGYIGCSTVLRDYLINTCKGLIYSTGLSPAILGAISAALEIIPQLTSEREQLLKNANRLRCFFHEHELQCGNSNSHIIPWIIGSADQTRQVSALLADQGILASTIRPPTVPHGKSRIRFCLSALHSEEDLEKLMKAISFVISSFRGKSLHL